MKAIGLILVSLSLLLIAWGSAPAGDQKTADLLVGRWVPASGKEKGTFVEFTKDGSMTYTFGTKDEFTLVAKYKVVDEKTLEVEWTEESLKKNTLLNPKPKKAQVSVSKNELTFDPMLLKIKKKWVRGK